LTIDNHSITQSIKKLENFQIMATNLNTIAQRLENRQWQYKVDHQSQTVITGVRTSCIAKFLIFIQLKENGDYVQFLAPQFCHLKGNVFKGVTPIQG